MSDIGEQRKSYPPIRIAVEAQCMVPPRSGVGRYAWELTQALEKLPEVQISYFQGSRWLDRWVDSVPSPIRPQVGRLHRRIKEMIPGGRHLRHALDTVGFIVKARTHHTQLVFAPNYIGPKTSLPTVITVHDISHVRHPEAHPPKRVAFLNQALPRAMRNARKIFVVSQFTAVEVASLFPDVAHKIQVIYPGVDRRFFDPQSAEVEVKLRHLLQNDSRRYFLFLATLEPRKNLQRVLAAYEGLPNAIRNAHPLVLAGQIGWRESSFAEPLSRLVAKKEAFCLGYVPDAVLPALYRHALALIYPALYEGFGLPPVEAMAAGCPVLVSNVTAMPEVCGDAALYCDPLNTESITEAMLNLADDENMRKRLSILGSSQAGLYQWDRAANMFLEAVKEIMDQP